MNYFQLVFSPTGGTRKVADAVMGHWGPAVETIDLSDGEADFSQCIFKAEDVVLIAMPSYCLLYTSDAADER